MSELPTEIVDLFFDLVPDEFFNDDDHLQVDSSAGGCHVNQTNLNKKQCDGDKQI